MTVTGKNGQEQQLGRVVRMRGLDQRCVLLDDAGNRITRFDDIIRDVEATGMDSWPIARVLLIWQRHVWERGCPEDYLGLVWEDALERVAPVDATEFLVPAVVAHLRDGQCRVSFEEQVGGFVNHLLGHPVLRYVHGGAPGAPLLLELPPQHQQRRRLAESIGTAGWSDMTSATRAYVRWLGEPTP